jgi:endo-1,4-beta-mannosidase
VEKAVGYIDQHLAVAEKLNKPLVIEEFGLPRDNQSFDTNSSTSFQRRYYARIFSILAEHARKQTVILPALLSGLSAERRARLKTKFSGRQATIIWAIRRWRSRD